MTNALAAIVHDKLQLLLSDLRYTPGADWQHGKVMQYPMTDEHKLVYWINYISKEGTQGKNWAQIMGNANKLHNHLKGLNSGNSRRTK